MRPKHLVSIVLIAVVLVMLMRNNNSMTNARPLVYRESLDEVAAQINGETLTLRDMAFYVGYEEYQIQQEALVYDCLLYTSYLWCSLYTKYMVYVL